jgi:bacillithiol system protein YtxJ
LAKKLIHSIEEFKQIAESESEFLFIKHSLTCPISQAAYEEFENFVEDAETVPAYYLHVQNSRILSNYIADEYNVKHESPQALFIKAGEVKWHDSHWNITYDKLQTVMNK